MGHRVKGFIPHKYTVEIYKSTEKSTKIKVEGFILNGANTYSSTLSPCTWVHCHAAATQFITVYHVYAHFLAFCRYKTDSFAVIDLMDAEDDKIAGKIFLGYNKTF